jgi:hypothetical protein
MKITHASEFEASEQLDAVGVLPAGTKTFAPDGTALPR